MATKRRRWIFTGREITCMAVPLALVGAFRLKPEALVQYPPGVHALRALGRTGICSREQALDSFKVKQRQDEAAQLIGATSKALAKDRNLVHYETPRGRFWAPKDTDLFWVLAEQERRIYGDGKFRVRPGDIVLDCGANVGTFAREALDAGAKVVVLIEPSPNNVESMRRTFAPEVEQGRIIIYAKGVWNEDSELPMYVYENSVLDSFVMKDRSENGSKKTREIRLPLTTIDKIVAELKLDRVDFIKMDIEGCERQAIQGAAATLARFKPRMSIATENLQDDQYVVSKRVMAANASYRYKCGPCTPATIYEIRPEVLFFY